MFEATEYELIDFGNGRKLERFGAALVDRPSPAATSFSPAEPDRWSEATARFGTARHDSARHDSARSSDDARNQWHGRAESAAAIEPDEQPWAVRHGATRFLLRRSESGNVGLFPEQAANWDWIADQVASAREVLSSPPRVLNLFAYTGGASLAAAAVGAEVVHVDSSAPTVTWARQNAEASGLTEAPVRWLVEDAVKFVQREAKRGNRYHGIIADPPTYGHGPKGKAFKIEDQLPRLMAMCGELLALSVAGTSPGFLVFSCHAPGFGPTRAANTLSDALASSADAAGSGSVEALRLMLRTRDGRELPAGVGARWSTA